MARQTKSAPTAPNDILTKAPDAPAEHDVVVDAMPSEPNVEEILNQINDSVDDIAGEDVLARNAITPGKHIALDEEVACKSITYGTLVWISQKTGAYYQWNDIGSEEYLTFAELKTMLNTSRNFLFKPRIIIQDPRVVAYFRLQPVYEKVARIHQLDKILRGSVRDVEDALDTILKVGMRDVVVSKVREMRHSGKLTNIDIIKLLEKKLCFDLSDDVAEQD